MRRDLKESLMILSGSNVGDYLKMMKISGEDFFVRYKLFIDQAIKKQEEAKVKNGR